MGSFQRISPTLTKLELILQKAYVKREENQNAFQMNFGAWSCQYAFIRLFTTHINMAVY